MCKYLSRLLTTVPVLLAVSLAQAQSPALGSEEAAFLQLINQFRAQNGVGPLQVSSALQAASQWMSADMAAKSYLSHTDSLGRDPFKRMADFGYRWSPAGENLAAGYSGAQATLDQWAASPGHRANMLNASYKAIGIGRAYNGASPYRWYWTTNFGGYLDQGTTPTPPTVQPPVVSYFSANPLSVTTGQPVSLVWNVSGATSVAIDNGVGTVTGMTSTTVVPGATTTYRLTATNAGGATSASVTVRVQLPSTDVQPPSMPGYLYASASTATQVEVFWGRSTDDVGVAGYQLIRNGSVLTALPPSANTFSDRSTTAGTTYTYGVRAYDAQGNYSGLRQSSPITTPGSASPYTPSQVVVVSGSSQMAAVNTVFSLALKVKVMNAAGQGVPGVAVTFRSPATGPSASFAGGVTDAVVMTDASGVATSSSLYANATGGAYSITAAVSGLTPASFTLTNTSASTPPPTSGALTIWGNAAPSYRRMIAAGPYELGMKFRSDIAGKVTGVRFFKTSDNNGVHTGSLWTASGQRLATGMFTNETASGWQTLTFATPVPIAANTTYVVSYHTSSGTFAGSLAYFQFLGGDNGSLHALRDGVSGPNGVAIAGPGGTFPSSPWYGTNFWVDVLFVK
jgi:hypothetical protein